VKHRKSCVLSLALYAAAGLAMAGDQAPEADQDAALAVSARTFVERFLAGDDSACRAMLSIDMLSALPVAAAGRVRQGLQAGNGSVREVRDAWPEDVVETYRRFRVPVVFERGTVDMRVVFDGEGKVAGFFHLPHVPSPQERADDPSLCSDPSPAVRGHWEGSIEIPGAPLAVRIDLLRKDGYWVGTIDIPAQGVEGLPLAGIAVIEPDIAFTIADIPGDPIFRGTLTDGEIAGTFTQAAFSASFRLGREVAARPARSQEPQPPFPYEEIEVAYDNGPVALAGTLTVPQGDGPFAAALLISGSGAQDRDETVYGHRPFRVLADHLARAGIAVLRVDDRGVGASTGDPGAATTEDFAEDALAGVAFLAQRPEIDPGRIGLIGHSEGGIIAPLAAVRSADVAFIVLLAGTGVTGAEVLVRQVELIGRAEGQPVDQVDQAVEAQRELVRLVLSGSDAEEIRARLRTLVRSQIGPDEDEEAVEQAVAMQALNVSNPWFRFFLSHDPRPVLRQVRVPVLALCGERDLQVEAGQNLPEIYRALARGGNADFTVEEMPGLNHLFQAAGTGSPTEYYDIGETINPAALEAVSGWIRERFVGAVTGEEY